MSTKKVVGTKLCIIAIVSALCALVLTPGVVSAADIIFVGPGENYTTIQSAVTAANPFDTIIVRDGTYNENVNVNVAHITIRSENGSSNCIVQALSASDHVFEVTADYVNISGFTVRDATGSDKAGIYLYHVAHCNISNNNASYNDYGIYMSWYSTNNNLTGNTANSNTEYGIYLHTLSNYNNLTGNTASYNYYGIYLLGSHTNTLTGNTVSYNYDSYGYSRPGYGIFLQGSNTNTLTGNTASYNPYGIYLEYSYTNNLTGNTASYNTGTEYSSGIYLYYSRYNNLTGNTASYNPYGIYLYSNNSRYNNLINNTANSNVFYGIYLDYSSTNNLTGNTALNNNYGIRLWGSSNNNLFGNTANSNNLFGLYLSDSSTNNLTGNIANSNTFYGIYLSDSGANIIYNNYFNNTYQNAWDNGNNVWNVTKTEGRNIIGGPNLGGNYWSGYTGNDTDGDGLGDTPYNIPGGANKDYLPLVVAPHIFDTGKGDYPSIAGIHNGTIKLNQTITVSKLYTYPCIGTGGHTKYVKIWQGTETLVEESRNGYVGDWHNITFNQPFILRENETYNYTIRTGSYPQIIHAESKDVTGGRITCEEFEDVNGYVHTDWIPAIRLG